MYKEILLWDLACHIKIRFMNSQTIPALLENFGLIMKQKYYILPYLEASKC